MGLSKGAAGRITNPVAMTPRYCGARHAVQGFCFAIGDVVEGIQKPYDIGIKPFLSTAGGHVFNLDTDVGIGYKEVQHFMKS